MDEDKTAGQNKNPCSSLIELREYKYKELCHALGEETKTSDSKRAQEKRWSQYFSWDKPTPRIFRITEIYDVPREREDGRRSNGGARQNSGAKCPVAKEFSHLLNAFLHRSFNRNSYNGEADLCTAYFSNLDISTYFGLFGEEFYNAVNEHRNSLISYGLSANEIASVHMRYKSAWSDISKKIAEKRRSWIYNRVKNIDCLEFGDGIKTYVDDKRYEYKDDLLKDWKRYQAKYLRDNGFKTEKDVAENDKWREMIESISKNFDGYKKVSKVKKISFPVSFIREYDVCEIDTYRKSFNEKLVSELLRYFGKRVPEEDLETYKNIIDRYVHL